MKTTNEEAFYKSVLEQDRAPVVICNLKHEIIYMNPAAAANYAKRGGKQLIGKNLMECHNADSKEKIEQVLEWFQASGQNNMVYISYNEKQNKDLYMVALRDGEKLIGYYEKHEFRDREKRQPYDI